MRIILRLLLLGTCAAIGVALAVSLIETIPAEFGESSLLAQSAALTQNTELVDGASESNDKPPVAQGIAPVSTSLVQQPQQAPSESELGSAHPLPLEAPTNHKPADQPVVAVATVETLPATQPVSIAYQPAFRQEIDSLERTIQNLQDSHDIQRTQLRDTVEWLRSQPLPASIREQLDSAPIAGPRSPSQRSAMVQQPAPAVQQPAPVAPAPELETPRIKQEIQAGEGDNTLKLTLIDADIREVLDLLGRQAGLNILPSPNVQGKMSASISNVDVETALDALLQSNGFTWRREGPFIHVGTRADFVTIDRDRDRIATRVYRPNYVSASEVQNLITNMLTAGVGAVTVSTAPEIDIPADNVHTGGDSFGGSDVILVRDYETVLMQIRWCKRSMSDRSRLP